MITKPQLVMINRALNDYEHLRLSYRVLSKSLSTSDSLMALWKHMAFMNDSLVRVEERRFKELHTMNEALHDELYQKDVKLTKARKNIVGVGIGGTLLGFILTMMLSK